MDENQMKEIEEKIRKLRKVTLWKVANGTLQRC